MNTSLPTELNSGPTNIGSKILWRSLILVGLLFILMCATAVEYVSVDWPLVDDFLTLQWYKWHFLDDSKSLIWLLLKAGDGPHPLGVQVILTLYLFHLFGINFNAIVFLNFFLILASSLLISSVTYRDLWRKPKLFYGVTVFIALLFMTPVQIHDVFWPFTLGWLLINFFLCLNIFIVEYFPRNYWQFLPITGVLGYFCSAHGIFIWPAAVIHILIKRECKYRFPFAILGICIFLIEAWIASRFNPENSHFIEGATFIKVLVYQLGLVGGQYGIRSVAISPWLGALLEISLVSFLAIAFSRRRLSALSRMALVLALTSTLMSLAFTWGRFQFGLMWALGQFHAAALIVLLSVALLLFCIDEFNQHKINRLSGFALGSLIFVILSSVITSIPYAIEEGRQMRFHRQLSVAVTCSSSSSPFLVAHVNGGPEAFFQLIDEVKSLWEPLCLQKMDTQVTDLISLPSLYQALILQDPSQKVPLTHLWDEVLSQINVSEGLKQNKDDFSMKKLHDAASGTLIGDNEQIEYIRPYQDDYRILWSKLKGPMPDHS